RLGQADVRRLDGGPPCRARSRCAFAPGRLEVPIERRTERPGQIPCGRRARPSVPNAIPTIAVTTPQNSGEDTNVCALKFTFIPATPARRAPGRSRIEARVSTFMI